MAIGPAVPSRSLVIWRTHRQRQLDDVERAHAALASTGRGRNYGTEQVNRAYAVLLASQFQGFCRGLHSEAADVVANATAPALLGPVMRERLLAGRQLDRGNAQPSSIGSDFGRFFASRFWEALDAASPRFERRRAELEALNAWRNAIVHQDFAVVGASRLRVAQVRRWRVACRDLAVGFDRALGRHLRMLVGSRPW